MMMSRLKDVRATEILTYESAVAVPMRRGQKSDGMWDAGLFDSDGTPIPHGRLDLHNLKTNPTQRVFEAYGATPEQIPGKWLFAGVVPNRTGHVILNALGRLWATDQLPEDVGLLYVPHNFKGTEHTFLKQLLETLGQKRRCKLVRNPSRVENLLVGPDGFSSALRGRAAPQAVEWIRRRANPQKSQRGTRKLYITRGRLSPLLGRYLCEDVFEENLANAGYEIIVPESMSLRAQFDLYSEANEVIAAEGTALHIAAMALPDSARLIVIQRRHDVPDLIENHLGCFLPTPPLYIDAVDTMHWPEERAVNVALTTLDFERLRESLINNDLIKPSDPWKIPTASAITESRGRGRGESARFLTLDERQEFIKEFRRARRQKQRRKLKRKNSRKPEVLRN